MSPAGTTSGAPSGTTSEDEEWAGIVAMFERGSEAPVAPWPVSEDVDDDAPGDRAWPAEEPRGLLRRRPREGENPLDGPREELEDPVGRDPADDDHYVAPPPPPVPRAHPAFWGSIVAILLGLVLMVRPDLVLGSPSSNGTFGFGILLVMVGSGVLVWRLKDGPPTDSGSEDGAVV